MTNKAPGHVENLQTQRALLLALDDYRVKHIEVSFLYTEREDDEAVPDTIKITKGSTWCCILKLPQFKILSFKIKRNEPEPIEEMSRVMHIYNNEFGSVTHIDRSAQTCHVSFDNRKGYVNCEIHNLIKVD